MKIKKKKLKFYIEELRKQALELNETRCTSVVEEATKRGRVDTLRIIAEELTWLLPKKQKRKN